MSYGGGNNYSSYGNNAGGGGGFYAGSQGGQTQGSPSSEARSRGTNTLRPVTIKQILEATEGIPDAPFKIDGVEITHITFVGRVRSVAEQATNITFVIDDGTGAIDVKQWIDADNLEDGSARELEGQYVRVLGQLKTFSNKKHVGSHKIRAVTDYNEVQYHLLEATMIHLQLTRGPPEQFTAGGAGGAVANSAYGQTARGGDVTMGGMDNAPHGAQRNLGLPASTSETARLIYEVIRTGSESNEGLHYSVISQKSKLPMNVVTTAVDELLGTGSIYTTLDENHVALIDF